ncbi:MAG TPA: hypothetical protein VGW78_05945 [Candidatus Babeliales bacterium]|jgi:hypothetical protein|nr:hypothetical protein [Candidatus Babeliales bacterium]
MKNLILPNTIPLKTISGIVAFALWNILQNSIITQQIYTIPICFYNTDLQTIHSCPDTIEITLKGPKKIIQKLDSNSLALHINAQRCTSVNQQWMCASEGTIFVPKSVSVVYYNPTHIIVQPQTI